ncbi:MAG TPA: hypothetical protein VK395_17255 [Gemmataceae bacterium]|nr:hypothetical protein [Gemmataceae bacterium]
MSDTSSQVQPVQHLPQPAPAAAGTVTLATSPAAAARLRLWPAVVIIVIQWLVITVPGWIRPGTPEQLALMVNGAPLGAAAIALWWLFASRAPWRDRLMVLGFFVVSGVAMYPLYHATFNFRYYGPIVRGLPLATTFWIVWLEASSRLRWPLRRLGIFASILLAWCYCACLRVDGVNGAFVPDVSWRWSPTPEERFLAELSVHKGRCCSRNYGAGRRPAAIAGRRLAGLPRDQPRQPLDWCPDCHGLEANAAASILEAWHRAGLVFLRCRW